MSIVERRRHPRLVLKGTAILLAGENAVRSRLTNLSEGGFLAATLVTAPAHLLGRPAAIELRLDDPFTTWIRLAGSIVRIEPNHVAVALDETPSTLVRLIDNMTGAARAHQRVLSVILIDNDAHRRGTIAYGFRAVGCNVIEASTSLEAIVRLGETSFEPDVIAIGDSVADNMASEMREFVARNHPRVKVLAITDDLVEPAGIENWLSSLDPGADLPARIRSVLVRPRL